MSRPGHPRGAGDLTDLRDTMEALDITVRHLRAALDVEPGFTTQEAYALGINEGRRRATAETGKEPSK